MRKFIVEIECGNAAFDNFYNEIASCLSLVAGAVMRGTESGVIRDTNGNTVGSYKMAEDRYRVVYGETRPAWERTFPSMHAARAFAKKHKSLGDVIFSVKKVVPGEPPQSLMGAIDTTQAENSSQ